MHCLVSSVLDTLIIDKGMRENKSMREEAGSVGKSEQGCKQSSLCRSGSRLCVWGCTL